ncbi:DUF6695 family protein [Algibacter mikhailovii]|uniref:Uncharacterized protein n=1 Tax=Algibacter mikhailovii TaxID=425498 RepID=A0A918R0I6_9FLAO|nr:DUF6695 family protein [Algibacter mikhailovii]GGZ77338.1 hypothetical protein GCM10007028_13250 [Algibacter mikhailovii]
MNNTGIILTLAYPDTVVMVSKEWFSPYLKYIGIGKKNYLRAGHAALVLIEKETGVLEYYDFGRYITTESTGRVRGRDTDNELHFPMQASMAGDSIANINSILEFLATHPKLTHGEGKLVASVCNAVDYNLARSYITEMQNMHFVRYAAFIKNASNCARFVTDTLIASVTNASIRKKLKNSKWFTPSTIGNVLIADTEQYVYEVTENGMISQYTGSKNRENLRCFFDKLRNHEPSVAGSLEPKAVAGLDDNAQWLSGIGSGAWYELYATSKQFEYRYRRISPYGNIDVDAIFILESDGFDYHSTFKIVHYSNCAFFHVEQSGEIFRFNRKL